MAAWVISRLYGQRSGSPEAAGQHPTRRRPAAISRYPGVFRSFPAVNLGQVPGSQDILHSFVFLLPPPAADSTITDTRLRHPFGTAEVTARADRTFIFVAFHPFPALTVPGHDSPRRPRPSFIPFPAVNANADVTVDSARAFGYNEHGCHEKGAHEHAVQTVWGRVYAPDRRDDQCPDLNGSGRSVS